MGQVDRRPEVTRRLVLGFDAGCMTCSELAKRIEEQAGGKLEVRGLRDPEMVQWREQALGENAPSAPTLVEVRGAEVRAWTGVRMGAHLVRRLGPSASWRVAKVLGEMSGADKGRRSSGAGLTRSQFLLGFGGAVVGMSVLSGAGSLSASAAAERHWLATLSFSSSQELSRKQSAVAWARLARGQHLRSLLLSSALSANPAVSRVRSRMLAAATGGVASPPAATVKGVMHDIEGGGKLLALVYQEDDALMAAYSLDKPGQETRQYTLVIEDESEETVKILAEAEDGNVYTASQGEAGATSRGRRCSSERQCPGVCSVCRCASASKRCLFNCCAPCAFSCRYLYPCLACVVLYCPLCATINRCCNYKACTYNRACS